MIKVLHTLVSRAQRPALRAPRAHVRRAPRASCVPRPAPSALRALAGSPQRVLRARAPCASAPRPARSCVLCPARLAGSCVSPQRVLALRGPLRPRPAPCVRLAFTSFAYPMRRGGNRIRGGNRNIPTNRWDFVIAKSRRLCNNIQAVLWNASRPHSLEVRTRPFQG